MYVKKRRPKNGSAAKMLGAQLATFRRAAGYTQESLAERAAIGAETIASIEQGRRVLKPDQAALLDELLKTSGVLNAAMAHMPEVDQIPAWAEEYVDLEREAITIWWYEGQVIPGLLQTENHARSVLGNRVPAFDEDEIVAQTCSRMNRQALLRRPAPPTLSFVVWEPVLSLRIGSAEECKEQIRHLRACAEMPSLTLQVLPISSLSHAGLDGPFILLETPDHQRVGYTETQRGSQLITAPDEISILLEKYAMLRTQALNTEDTKSLLDRLGE